MESPDLEKDRVEASVIAHYPTALDANNSASQPYLPREKPCHEAGFISLILGAFWKRIQKLCGWYSLSEGVSDMDERRKPWRPEELLGPGK